MSEQSKHVDYAALSRYDNNIKAHIDNELSETINNSLFTKQDLSLLLESVANLSNELNSIKSDVKTVLDRTSEIDKMLVTKADKDYIQQLLPSVKNDYATPEQYGAVGDGIHDDTQAIQECIDNNLNIRLSKDYLISNTLTVNKELSDTENPYLVYNGKTITGSGSITISTDKNLLELYGSKNTIEGITLRYSSKLVNYKEEKINYSSSLLSLISPIHKNDVYPCCDNIITNVNICAGTVQYKNYPQLGGNGIEFITEGKGYCYNNFFDNCSCFGMANCLKATVSENTNGVNANIINVSSWCCMCYINGPFGGCHFKGNCQARILNCDMYLVQNLSGVCNTIDTYFYDLRSKGFLERQFLIDDTASKLNNFTNHISFESVDNYNNCNTYNFLKANNIPVFHTNGYHTGFLDYIRVTPSCNALPKCLESATIVNKEDETLTSKITCYYYAGYPTYDNTTFSLADCSYLCGDNPVGRCFYASKVNSSDTSGYIILNLTFKENTYVDFLCLECSGGTDYPRITEATIEQVTSDSTIKKPLTVLQQDNYNTVRALVNTQGVGLTGNGKIHVSLKIEFSATISLQRLTGVCRDIVNGSY